VLLLLFLISSILNQVSEKLSSIKSVECNFTEVLTFHGDTLNFTGSVYAIRDKARIDVYAPEKEVMIFEGDSVFVWREETGQIYRSKTPMVFYNVLFSPAISYRVDSTSSNWTHLSPIKDEFGYPISVRFNKNFLPEKINFVQEAGGGAFTFNSYKLNKTYSENFFSLDFPTADKSK